MEMQTEAPHPEPHAEAPKGDEDLTLPQITARLREIVFEIIDNGGVVDDELDAQHTELAELADEKTAAYVAVIKELKAKSKAVKELENHYKDRRRALENTIRSMKDRLLWSMDEVGVEVRDTEPGKVRVHEHHTRRLEVDAEPERLPKAFQRITVSPDKDKIREKMEEVGADQLRDPETGETIAHLEAPSRYVRIY